MKQFSLANLLTFCLVAFLLVGFLFERNRAKQLERKLDLIRVPLSAQIQKLESSVPQKEMAVQIASDELDSRHQQNSERNNSKSFSFSFDARSERTNLRSAKTKLLETKEMLRLLREQLEPLK